MFRRKHQKYITFTVAIKSEVIKIHKTEGKVTKTASYVFTDSASFVARSLSALVKNVPERTHKIKYKYLHNDKNVKLLEFHTMYTNVFFNAQA